jgi:uncharacterized damage-inducible protein DinB
MATAEELVEHWMSHRKVTEALLECIPDDRADFRPWSKAMTTVELANHIAGAHIMFTTVASGRPFERPDASSMPRDMAGVRAFMRQATSSDEATLRGLDSAALARQVTQGGREQSAETLLRRALDHEIHHKGELFEYARLSGVEEVPNWVMR